MKIVMLAVGSRGDVQPIIALGAGLLSHGHSVCLVTHQVFKELAESYKLKFMPLVCDPNQILHSEIGISWQESSKNPLYFSTQLKRIANVYLQGIFEDAWKACRGAEVIIFSPLAIAGYHIAEKLKIPCFAACLIPFHPTSMFPSPLIPFHFSFNFLYNYFTHLFVEKMFVKVWKQPVNFWRKKFLDLPPIGFTASWFKMGKNPVPFLYGYSSHVVPRPGEWKDHLHITGYWFLDHNSRWKPPGGLVDFLHSGPSPLYIGFGSIIHRDPEKLTDIIITALKRAKKRAILVAGWGALHIKNPDLNGKLSKDLYIIKSVPHDFLFPKMAAAIHHGGAGTTAASLRAGIPTQILPFFADQFFWGRRIADLKAGPAPFSIHSLTAEKLTKAILDLTNTPVYSTRTRALAEKIKKEDGVTRAVAFIHKRLGIPL